LAHIVFSAKNYVEGSFSPHLQNNSLLWKIISLKVY